MCRRPRLVLVLLTLASTLAAQTPEDIAGLERRADSLARLWSEADALANLADSLARVPVVPETDTLRVGGLTIISNRSPLPLRAAAQRAWPVIDSLYGSAAEQLGKVPYLIQAVDPDSVGREARRWALLVPWDLSPRETADLLLVYVPIQPADQAFQQWAGNTLRPSPRGWSYELGESYVALATGHYAISEECLAGALERCRTLLGLDRDYDPLRLYATLSERQKVARRLSRAYEQAGVGSDVVLCLAGSDSSCQAALLKVPAAQLPSPASSAMRMGLAALAMRVGGREAYTRLMRDSLVPMPERLARASGVPLDSLLRLWHTAVIEARPKPVVLPPFAAAVGLGWGLIFGLAALRSSRWRAL